MVLYLTERVVEHSRAVAHGARFVQYSAPLDPVSRVLECVVGAMDLTHHGHLVTLVRWCAGAEVEPDCGAVKILILLPDVIKILHYLTH